MDLYYEIVENGYHIFDKNDPLFHIYQYEPHIPKRSKSYEENALEQIHEIMVNNYVAAVRRGDISLDDIPEEYYDEVEAIVNANSNDITDEQIAEIEQKYRDRLVEEVNNDNS